MTIYQLAAPNQLPTRPSKTVSLRPCKPALVPARRLQRLDNLNTMREVTAHRPCIACRARTHSQPRIRALCGAWARGKHFTSPPFRRGVATSSLAWPGQPHSVRPVESAPGAQTPDSKHPCTSSLHACIPLSHCDITTCPCCNRCLISKLRPCTAPHDSAPRLDRLYMHGSRYPAVTPDILQHTPSASLHLRKPMLLH